jgi:hypothetical protein
LDPKGNLTKPFPSIFTIKSEKLILRDTR